MSFGKGSNTTTQTTQPDANAYGAYNALLAQAGSVASTPYQAYTGELVAPVNQQQQAGINTINQYATAAQPYYQTAGQMALSAASPITSSQINSYLNPYTQDVVNATQAQFANYNAQQQQQVVGNAAAQGALGGDRVAVAQSQLAGQQALNQAPTIAGLYSSGYNTALQTALSEQQQQAAGAYSLANIGQGLQSAGLTGGNAQVGAGTLQQQTQQAQDTALYGQYQVAQAYPYQQTQWLAGVDTGVGSQMGGTATTTSPSNLLAQVLGAGVVGASLIGGGGTKTGARGGRVNSYAFGGTPWSGAQGYIPTMQITPGRGAPQAPSGQSTQQQSQQYNTELGQAAKIGQASSPGVKNVLSGVGSSIQDSMNQLTGAAGYNWPTQYDLGPGLQSAGGRVMPSEFGEVQAFALGGAPRRHYADAGTVQIDPAFAEGLDQYTQPIIVPATGFGGTPIDLSTSSGAAQSPSFGQYANPVVPATGPSVPFESLYPDPGAFRPVGADPQSRINTGFEDTAAAINAGIFDPQGANANVVGKLAGVVPTPTPRPQFPSDTPGGTGMASTAPTPPPQRGIGRQPMDIASAANATPVGAINPSQPAPQQPSQGGGGFGLGLFGPEVQQGLMAAGLGMMASRSPSLGIAIGEGGLRGLQTYQGVIQQEQAAKLNERKMDLEVQKLAQQAEESRKSLEMKGRELGLREQEYKQPFGWTVNKDGTVSATPGGPHDPNTIRAEQAAKLGPGMDDDTLRVMVDSYRRGNTGVLSGIGRGIQGSQNLNRFWSIMKEEGATGAELAAAKADYTAQTAAARTSAVREANIETAINEAVGTFSQARSTSANVPRTSFTPINSILEKIRRGTSSTDQASLDVAIQGVITAYSQAMSRTGANSVHAQQHAEALLSTVDSDAALNARLDQMEKEMQIAKAAPEKTRKDILEKIMGKGSTNLPDTAGGGGGGTQMAEPMPANKNALQPDHVYMTSRGPARWDGTKFVQ